MCFDHLIICAEGKRPNQSLICFTYTLLADSSVQGNLPPLACEPALQHLKCIMSDPTIAEG